MKINNKMNIFCTGNAQKDGFVNILINIIELNKSFDKINGLILIFFDIFIQ